MCCDEDADDCVVCQAVDMDCFEVNYMKVKDKCGTKRDWIKIKGSLKLVDGAAFDPDIHVVAVIVNGDELAIPARSFKKKSFWSSRYYCFKGEVEGVGYVHMHLNFKTCHWWIRIAGKESSGLVDSSGATVELSIGNNLGNNKFDDWTKTRKSDKTAFAKFFQWPRVRCCHSSGKW
jgi:hypothetical protein